MFMTRPEITGTSGVASSTHWLASQVAMSVLECGGCTFDATAAGGFELQVVEPHLNGPADEVPILFWSESAQRMAAVNAQGWMPALAILGVRDLFVGEWTSCADVWLVDGRVPVPGSLFRWPALAATYKRIVETARREASTRTGEIEAAARLRRAADRCVLQEAGGARQQRRAPHRPAVHQRHGGLAGCRRLATDRRLRPFHGRQVRVGAGRIVLRAAANACGMQGYAVGR
ncbi:hypothetical protein QTI05_13225 [Variovorax sp. J22R193]|uniref:hypothetical protein n=2 Tax=Variovorax fucosicus TaxID=3053517 RepID=UPI0025769FBB|nr:hypothetical protein [Variovorax sp. J22G21]MDM0039997.1 hypothetical protein [Variovorax sp. J22R193]